ncbi:MAG: protease HtpX [Succinivibrio sp.]
MLKRGILYIATMLGVMIVIGIVVNVVCAFLGIYITRQGIGAILVLSLFLGFFGSIVSLLISKSVVKASMRVRTITSPRTQDEAWLLSEVSMIAKRKGVAMPEVGIYPSEEMNAFATGWNRDAALVAVSSGILSKMSRDSLSAVLGHELSHVQNGDMVTMCLVQGIVNTFVYALSYIIAGAAAGFLGSRDRDDRGSPFIYYMVQSVLQMLFGFLGTLVVLWFSRHREYAADAGSAEVLGKDRMINALLELGSQGVEQKKNASIAALCIVSGGSPSELFMTHPTIENRVAALRALPY